MTGAVINTGFSELPDLTFLDSYQSALLSIYDINIPHTVSDFVTTDQKIVSLLTDRKKDHLKEKLLVHQEGEDINLSLYLHHDVVSNLLDLSADGHLERENIENLCLAIEGISHFLYLIWRATRKQQVSLFELELQAEVDKYVFMLFLIKNLKKHEMLPCLRRILFDEVRFDRTLDEAELIRYRKANHYAARYCSLFEGRYLQYIGSREMFHEVRDFYRLGENEKLNRIVNYPL